MFVYPWLLIVANYVIAPLSIIACIILFIIYHKLPQKSTAMKTILFICIFDFVLAILNTILPLILDLHDLCRYGSPLLNTVLLSSLYTSTLLARNSLKGVEQEDYDPDKTFYRDLLIIIFLSACLSFFPLIPNGFITYGEFCCMQSPVKDPSDLIVILGAFYIIIPILTSIGFSLFSYTKIFRLFRDFYGEQANGKRIKIKILFLSIIWQVMLYTPLTLTEIYAMDRKFPANIILYFDLFFTRIAGAINCCIYFFIRVRRPEILKHRSSIKNGLIDQGLQEILMTYDRSVIGEPENRRSLLL